MAQLDKDIEPTIFNEPVEYSLGEIAEIAGTSIENVFNMTRWIGSSPKDATTKYLTKLDLAAVTNAVEFAKEEGMDDESMGTLLRGMGFSMERLATRQVEAVIQRNAEKYGVGDTEARLMAAAQAPGQAAGALKLLEHVYRRHLAIATRRLTTDAIAQRGLVSNEMDYPLVRAVGFADLVDFTSRTEHASAQEFTELIQNFRDRTWDIVNSKRGRTINYIGDAVFYLTDTIEEGAEVALALAEPGALGVSGQVRVSLVWARIIATYGDAYGPGVNLAARISAAAEPGEVLLGPMASAMLARVPRYRVTPRGNIDAHGIGPVSVASLRHASDTPTATE